MLDVAGRGPDADRRPARAERGRAARSTPGARPRSRAAGWPSSARARRGRTTDAVPSLGERRCRSSLRADRGATLPPSRPATTVGRRPPAGATTDVDAEHGTADRCPRRCAAVASRPAGATDPSASWPRSTCRRRRPRRSRGRRPTPRRCWPRRRPDRGRRHRRRARPDAHGRRSSIAPPAASTRRSTSACSSSRSRPGDPQVHLAIANLQLDRGWTALATEKIELLLRLTALTGDTQAEADVHGLASERLRDEPPLSAERRARLSAARGEPARNGRSAERRAVHSPSMPQLLESILDQVRLADDPGHRDHGAPDLLAVQPHPGDERRAPRRSASRCCSRSTSRPASCSCGCSPRSSRRAPSSACSRSSSSSSPSCAARSTGSAASARWAGSCRPRTRDAELVATEVARAAAVLSAEGHGALIVIERETGLEQIAETGVMIHGDLSADLAADDLLAEVAAPRRGGDRPRRPDPRRRRAAAARRDDDPLGALRDAPPGRAGHDRADRRDRRRRVRGERPDQPRPAGADRAQPQRGAARPRAARACSSRAQERRAAPAARRACRAARSPRLAGPRPRGPDRRAATAAAVEPLPPDEPMRPGRRGGPDAVGADAAMTTAGRRPTADGARRTRRPKPDRDQARAGRDPRPGAMTRVAPVHRPQLAAQARRGRAGDAAVRRPRPVADDPAFTGTVPIQIENAAGRRDRPVEPRLGDAHHATSPRPTSACASTARRSGLRRPQRRRSQRGSAISLDVTVEAVDTAHPGPRLRAARDLAHRRPRRTARSVPIRAVLAARAVRPRRRRPDRSRATTGDRQRAAVGRRHGGRGPGRRSSIDASGIDVNQLVHAAPGRRRTATGSARRGSTSSPPRSASACPVFTDRRSKTLPVTPNVDRHAGGRLRGRVGRPSTRPSSPSRATPTTWPASTAPDTAADLRLRARRRRSSRTSGSRCPTASRRSASGPSRSPSTLRPDHGDADVRGGPRARRRAARLALRRCRPTACS